MAEPSFSRRRFLETSGAALAAASLAKFGARSLLAAEDRAAEPTTPLGFAFVGLGGFALNQLLPGISRCKFCKPVALVSGHPDKAAAVARQYGIESGNIYNYENFDSIGNNPRIDVVYIVLPNGMHADYTVRAFAAGKHVMCEKPMANTVEECRQMIAAAKAAGKKLQIGYRMHWDAPTLACIDALRNNQIGPIQIIEAETGFTIGDPTQWRLNRKLAGGGCLMDIGIYSLSAARYLSGEEPTEVFAHTYQNTDDPRFKEVEQNCDFQLKFPSGVLASCLSSYNANMNRYVVHGRKGHCVLDPGQAYKGVKFQISRGRALEPVDVPAADQFVGEMDGFAQALSGKAPFKATGEEGLQDLRIIEAIYESARTGKSVEV
ncbi:MAG: Gfo/Idh/MocA family oxidoreductase [Tepidisphaeraceae bacterium]